MKTFAGRVVGRVLPADRDTRRGMGIMGGIGLCVMACIVFGMHGSHQSGMDVNADLANLTSSYAAPMVAAAHNPALAAAFRAMEHPPTDAGGCNALTAGRTTVLAGLAQIHDEADTVRYLEERARCEHLLGASQDAFTDYRDAATARVAGDHYQNQQRIVAELLYAQSAVRAQPDDPTARLLVADALTLDKHLTVTLLHDRRLADLDAALGVAR